MTFVWVVVCLLIGAGLCLAGLSIVGAATARASRQDAERREFQRRLILHSAKLRMDAASRAAAEQMRNASGGQPGRWSQ